MVIFSAYFIARSIFPIKVKVILFVRHNNVPFDATRVSFVGSSGINSTLVNGSYENGNHEDIVGSTTILSVLLVASQTTPRTACDVAKY